MPRDQGRPPPAGAPLDLGIIKYKVRRAKSEERRKPYISLFALRSSYFVFFATQEAHFELFAKIDRHTRRGLSHRIPFMTFSSINVSIGFLNQGLFAKEQP
jgi:hypothetical protein